MYLAESPTLCRTYLEVRQMSSDYWAGRPVTAHLSTMGMTTIAGRNAPRFVR
jgi:hypothetical protein